MILKGDKKRGQGRTHEKTHDYDTQALRQDPAAKRSRDRKVFPACRVRQGLTETRRGQRRTSTPQPITGWRWAECPPSLLDEAELD